MDVLCGWSCWRCCSRPWIHLWLNSWNVIVQHTPLRETDDESQQHIQSCNFLNGQAFPDEIVMRDTLQAGYRGHEIHVPREMLPVLLAEYLPRTTNSKDRKSTLKKSYVTFQHCRLGYRCLLSQCYPEIDTGICFLG